MAFPTTLPEVLKIPILRRLAADGCPRALYERWCAASDPMEREALAGLRSAAATLPAAQRALANVERDRHELPPAQRERLARRLEARAALAGDPTAIDAVAWWELRERDDDPAARARARPGLERALRAGVGYSGFDLATTVETYAGDLRRVKRWLEAAVVLREDREDDSLFALEFVQWAESRLRRWRARTPEDWRARARAGEAEAQMLLATAHRFGRGVPYDVEAAQAWYERAAEAGNDEARLALGFLAWDYAADVDLEAGAHFAALAAASGDPTALWVAGRLDSHARWPSVHRAVKWWREGARRGHARCAREYARCFHLGTGVTPNARSQARWLRVAAEGGIPEAQLLLAELLEEGKGVPRNRRAAVSWMRRAAERGNADGQLKLGFLLHEGRGVRRDDRESVRWYRRAAAHGEPHAQSNLGLCYRAGHGVARNPSAARRWFEKAAWIHGHGRAAFYLGRGFEDGEFGGKDPLEAVRWYRLGAAVGDPDCLMCLGVCHHNGRPIERDREFAVLLYRAAATLGNAWAMHLLGLSYRDGEGVPADRRVARSWFRRAAGLGERKAARALRALGPRRAGVSAASSAASSP